MSTPWPGKRQRASTQLDGGYQYIKLARMAYYVNKEAYLQALQSHIEELQSPQPGTTSAAVASA